MSRFVQGADRRQPTLLLECLDDYVAEDNPVRVVDVFVDELDLKGLGFDGMTPAATGRPTYHPAMLLKLCLWLSEKGAVQPATGERSAAQCRADMAYGTTGAGSQDHRRLPPRERLCDPGGVCSVRGAVPPTGPVRYGLGRHGRLKV